MSDYRLLSAALQRAIGNPLPVEWDGMIAVLCIVDDEKQSIVPVAGFVNLDAAIDIGRIVSATDFLGPHLTPHK